LSAPAVPLERERLGSRVSTSWHRVALAGVLALAAFLDLFRLSQNGYANTYYSAAVRSMLSSWHNFFFVSFDPGGLVSVDKPPLALWVQAASAKLLGYSGMSILLPEALAGIAAVGLLYLLVARYFGRVAGLVAALALAVSPVSVAVNRDNNPDALFVLLLVAAAYVGARAVESGRLVTLLGTAVLVGLAFNTKMLAAAIVVPGIGLAYLVFVCHSWRTRLLHAALATLVLVAVSGAWITAVELTSAGNRPYVGSTSDNSALSLALGYNGLGRVTGQEGGTSSGGGLGGAFSGVPGAWRLLNDALGDQGAWLLPLAIVGGVSAFLAAIALRRRRQLAALVVVGGWFVAAAVIFSYSSGIIHTYYLSALAPATSALVGIGAVSLWRDARRGGAWVVLPIAAVALTAWLQVDLLRRSGYQSWLEVIVLLGAVLAVAALAALSVAAAFGGPSRRRVATAAVGVAVVALLAAPTVWSATTFESAVNGVFPGAGPNYISGSGGGGFRGGPPAGGGGFGPGGGGSVSPGAGAGGGFGGGSSDLQSALDYVESHGATSRFGLIVSSEQQAATAVIAGEPVAAMGGFTGRETVLTKEYLARLIRSGEARYFLLGSGGGFAGPGGSNNAAVSTVESACRIVPSSDWTGTTASGQSSLYDCAGSADAILGDG
jgi:4-amino-4-deoxy-L-arabinose transferase-like glycosyltransferase